MFREAGLDPSTLVDAAKRGYSGQGGPLTPIRLSSRDQTPYPEELRANTILKGLEEIDLYRIAAFQTPFAMPVKSGVRYSSGFGNRNDPFGRGTRRHEGQDMAGPYGTPIYATADGVVTHAGWQSGYGRLVKIRHPMGFETRYAHMAQIRVDVGQKVSRGDRIGDMGNSGRSTGTHLHYEVRLGGVAKNPMTFIKAGQNVF
jgi:murein DD-endopeptidase MepM/ murein hydrolase activator NlpD